MWDGINRRRFPRANYKCSITIKSSGEAPKVIKTMTENIGIGGICVGLKEDLDLFKNVELEVALNDNDSPITCNGSIVWVVKKTGSKNKETMVYDTGIEFIDIKEAYKKRILALVEKILG